MYFFSLQNVGFPTNWILFHINVVIIAQHFPTVLLAEKSDSSRNMSSQTKVMHFLKKVTPLKRKRRRCLVKLQLQVCMCFLSQSTGRILQQTVPVQSAVVEKKICAFLLPQSWLVRSKLSIYFFLSVILSKFFSFFIETLVLPLSVIVVFLCPFYNQNRNGISVVSCFMLQKR